jgi:hypothetical protein
MPIRIYELAKDLNLKSNVVLAKARELGVSKAKVPSSQIDKITGEWLRGELLKWKSTLPSQPSSGDIKPSRFGNTPSTPPIPAEELPILIARPPAINPAGPTKKDRPEVTEHPGQPARVLPAAVLPIPNKLAVPTVGRETAVKPAATPVAYGTPVRPEGNEPSYIRFERTVRRILDSRFPNCALSNVLLFRSESAHFSNDFQEDQGKTDYAFELDHLLHRANASQDNLIVIECKNQPIRVENDRTWNAVYDDRTVNILAKIRRQAETLRAYVNPLGRGRKLTINVIVVSSNPATETVSKSDEAGISFILCGTDRLLLALQYFDTPPLRVAQSDVLNLLRLGMPTEGLGHPELNNALTYIERCRRSIDLELFRTFSPTQERWAINGSAGMGKSVLLAYSLFVFSTNRRVEIQNGRKVLADFSKPASVLGLPTLGQRGVYAFALKEKQRQVLDVLFRRFVEEFSQLSKDADLGIRRPSIRLWDGQIPLDCQVLIIDEAHDLSVTHAATVAAWANEPDQKRYLLIACDRHQKLRLVGRDEAIIDGISFSRRTKKLRLNYRNPFAVYGASLGLMFRWFTSSGPKVLPTKDDLENGFGLTVEAPEGNQVIPLSMRNDSHPGNSWSHCVEWFSRPDGALARLRPFRFNPQDVLWVRFSDEDEHFDYEQLSCFTYHNLNCTESVELTDKYIKGQDFPIVVIEGISEAMNQWGEPMAEQLMWQRRKELYVCASRATAFLFLVGSDGAAKQEFVEIVRQLSAPEKDSDGFQRTWRFRVTQTDQNGRRKMDVFTDASEV